MNGYQLHGSLVPAPLLPQSGTLEKQSQLMGVWQARRVELDKGSFRYFKDGCREARGVLSKKDVQGVEGELPATILIHTYLAGGEDRTFRLRAPGGEDEMRKWVRCLQIAFDLEGGVVHPDPAQVQSRQRGKKSTFGTSAMSAAVNAVGAAIGQATKATGMTGAEQWVGDKISGAKRAMAQTRENIEEQMEHALTNCDEGTTQTLLDKAFASSLAGDKMPAVVRRAARRVAGRNLRDATESGDPKQLKGALVAAKRLQAVDVPEFKPAVERYKEVRRLPEGWDISQMLAERRAGGGKLLAKADVSHDSALRAFVQYIFDATFRSVTTRDRHGQVFPRRLEVVQVQEVQNESQWVDYMVRREQITSELKERCWLNPSRKDFFVLDSETDKALTQLAGIVALREHSDPARDPCAFRAVVPPGSKPGDEIEIRADQQIMRVRVPQNAIPGKEAIFLGPLAACLPGPPLETIANEAILFHGTRAIAAEKITSDDFRLDLAGSSAGTLYGRGIYLAENCTKADEYSHPDPATGLYTILLCRAALGQLLYSADLNPDPRQCEQACLRGDFHSVLGDRKACRGTYREFIVFDEDQVYPNYVVRYRRVLP